MTATADIGVGFDALPAWEFLAMRLRDLGCLAVFVTASLPLQAMQLSGRKGQGLQREPWPLREPSRCTYAMRPASRDRPIS